jgi:hypothetical protein
MQERGRWGSDRPRALFLGLRARMKGTPWGWGRFRGLERLILLLPAYVCGEETWGVQFCAKTMLLIPTDG